MVQDGDDFSDVDADYRYADFFGSMNDMGENETVKSSKKSKESKKVRSGSYFSLE